MLPSESSGAAGALVLEGILTDDARSLTKSDRGLSMKDFISVAAVAVLVLGGCHESGTPALSHVMVLRTAAVDTLYADHDLNRLVSFIPVDDGFVVAGSNSLHLLDSLWRPIRSFGRQGAGPVEFGRIAGLAVSGDTIFVLDPRNRRISMVDKEGKDLGIHLVRGDPEHPDIDAIHGRLALSGDKVLFTGRALPGAERRTNLLLMSLNWRTGDQDALLHIPGPLWVNGTTPIAGWRDPFGPRDVVSIPTREVLAFGNGVDDCLTVASLDGTRADVSFCLFRRRAVRARWTEAIEDTVWISDDRRRSAYTQLLAVQTPSTHLPRFDRLWLPDEKEIWVRRPDERYAGVHPNLIADSRRYPSDVEWEVYDENHSLTLLVNLPSRFEPIFRSGADSVLGILTTEYGVRVVVQVNLTAAGA